VEQALIGRKPTNALFKDVARLASSIEAQSDAFVKADYRRHLARVLTERALTESAHEDSK
jgi:CO/xanthine dehydrogenase FAD-binding subunit